MSRTEFRRSGHTIILSDVHLTEGERAHPYNPLWKRYKRPKLFVDRSFRRFLEHMQGEIAEPIELILNGDIFDFDSVMSIPESPAFRVSWLERKRGLGAEEAKSRYKMEVILRDHHVWVEALREFIVKGNRVVFIIGNHDMEMHWPAVQKAITDALDLPLPRQDAVRFCEWFYLSNHDTLVEHGNQYDDYCLCSNPIHPLIRKHKKITVRLPFGNLANKFMMNGMGLFNPHVQSNYIMSLWQYVVFFYRHMLRTQPLLLWTWAWGACATLFYSIGEGLKPAIKDPLTSEMRISQIAARANATPRVVRSLREIHAHPAIHDPIKILRELWLDRAFLFLFVCVATIQGVALLNLFVTIWIGWAIIPMALLMPFVIFYARSIKSDIADNEGRIASLAPVAAKIARVSRVVHGHTHHEHHQFIEGVEVINTGSWSPAFHDLECTKPFGSKPFAWIRPARPPASGSGARIAELHAWLDPGTRIMAIGAPQNPPIASAVVAAAVAEAAVEAASKSGEEEPSRLKAVSGAQGD